MFPVYSDLSTNHLIESQQPLYLNKGILKPMPIWIDGCELANQLLTEKPTKLLLRRGEDESLYYVTPRLINKGELVSASLGVPSEECVLMSIDSHDGYVCEKLGHYMGDGLQRTPFVWVTRSGKLYNQTKNLPNFCDKHEHEWVLRKVTEYHSWNYHEYKHCTRCSAVKDAAFPKVEILKASATAFKVRKGMEPKSFSMFPYYQREGHIVEMQKYTWSDGENTTRFICGGEFIENLELA